MDAPTFSILIATYNRPQQLQHCLEHIARLDYPRERFEVVIVDDGSPQPLDDIVAAFADRLCCQLIVQANAGVSAARNRGAAHARSLFLAILDDDCLPLTDWLTQFETQLQRTPQAIVGGQTLNALADNIYSEASHTITMLLYEYFNRDPHQACFFTAMNTAMRRDLFLEIGGYDDVNFPMAGEDRDLIDRWKERGFPAIYVPQAQVLHAHHLDLHGYLLQHCNYARVSYAFHKVHRARTGTKIGFEPMLHFCIWTYALRPGIKRSLWWRLRLQMLLYVEQGITLHGYFAPHVTELLSRSPRFGR